MKHIKLLYLFLLISWSSLPLQAADYLLQSPNGKLTVEIETKGQLSYTLKHNSQTLLDKSPIGLLLEDKILGEDIKISRIKRNSSVKEHIVSPHYRLPSFEVTYNELNLKFKGNYGIIFRAYNEGIAYRFYTTMKGPLIIKDEMVQMNFPKDYPTFMSYSTMPTGEDQYAMAFQNLYTKSSIKGVDTNNIAFLPITIDCGNELKMTLLESDLEDYPGMFIKGDGKNTSLQGTFAHYPSEIKNFPPRAMKRITKRTDYIARTTGERNYPWRIWAITEKDTEMPVNNLVYALASPNRIGDCSWIKTGKVAWDWWNDWGISDVDFKAGINMDTYKYYIDFAADNHIEFVILDEGWYNPEKGDMLTVIPELDLEELIRYGKSKGVDLILWTVFNVLDEHLEAACKKYSEMGISGFKVDFLDRDDQTAVEMTYRIADMTAKYKLTLDLHGFYKPTGLNRTYPNIINFEAVFGMEEMKWSSIQKDMMEYDVTMPYIRMMAGPVDYTPGAMRNASKKDFKDIYYNPMSQGTRCHQLAAYVVHDSPLTMLADNPTIYKREQECTDFIISIPNKGIEETRVLQGKVGESSIMARRAGTTWYIGGMTDWTAREITLDFDFLDNGNYEVILFKDGINADKQAEDYKQEQFTITPASKKKIRMASGGGFAMTITKK